MSTSSNDMYAGDFVPLEFRLLNLVLGTGFPAGASETAVTVSAGPAGAVICAAARAAEVGAAASEVTLGVAVVPFPPVGCATASGFLSDLAFLIELGLFLDLRQGASEFFVQSNSSGGEMISVSGQHIRAVHSTLEFSNEPSCAVVGFTQKFRQACKGWSWVLGRAPGNFKRWCI